MLLADGLVLSIYQVVHSADIVSHSCDSVDTSWISVYTALVFTGAANVVSILVIHFDAVQADIEEVSMSGIQV